MAGAGSLSATGRVDKLDARIDGAGSVELDKLAAVDAEVSVNGAGSLSVCASGNLNATVNGVGSITYSCNPQKTVTSLHGVGSIEPAGGKNP
jgi:spore coat protein U-like protein